MCVREKEGEGGREAEKERDGVREKGEERESERPSVRIKPNREIFIAPRDPPELSVSRQAAAVPAHWTESSYYPGLGLFSGE